MANDLIKPKGKIRYIVGLFCCLAYFVAFLDRSNIGVLIADTNFTEALAIAADKAAQGSLMSAFLFWYGLACFFIGPVVQRLGPHKSLVLGMLSWAILSGVMGLVNSLGVFLVCRALLGLGESLLGPSVAALIQAWFPKNERTTANGAWYISFKIAQIVATPVLAWWIYLLGWRASFFLLAIIGVIPMICAFWISDHPAKSKRITEEEREYISSGGGVSVLDSKKIDYSFLKNKLLYCILFLYAAVCIIGWGLMAWVPSYLRGTLGFSWAAMGTLTGVVALVAMASAAILTPIMDKINRRASFMVVCCIGQAIGLWYIGIADDSTSAVIVLALTYVVLAPVTPACFTMVQNLTSKTQVATATGVLNGVGYVSASISPIAMGKLADITGSLKAGFTAFAIVAVIGAVLSIPLMRQRL
jgi:sugar phosphate permease